MTKPKDNHVSDIANWQPSPDQSKDQIITWLYNRKDLHVILKKIAKNAYLREELTSFLFTWLCEMPQEKIQDHYQRKIIDYNILAFLSNQFHSKTSPFYHKIKKFEIGQAMTAEQREKVFNALYSDKVYDPDSDIQQIEYDLQADLKEEIESKDVGLYPAIDKLRSPGTYKDYHRDILLKYLQLKTIKAVSEEFDIRPEYISQALTDAKEMLRPIISQEVQEYLNKRLQELNN